MKTAESLGDFEQLVLLAVLRLAQDAYGVTVRTEIEQCTGRKTTSGALYTTLDRLEKKGLLKSWFGEPTPQRGGRAKRFFKLTPAGKSALVQAQRAYRRLLVGVDLFGGSHA